MFLTPSASDALPKLDPATFTLGRDEKPRAAPMCPFYHQVSSLEETFPSVPTSLSSAGFEWHRNWGWGQHPVTLLRAAWMQQLPFERSIPNPFSKFSPITAALCRGPQAPPAHTSQLQKKKHKIGSCSPPLALCIDKWSPWMNSNLALMVLISSCTLSHLALKITGR